MTDIKYLKYSPLSKQPRSKAMELGTRMHQAMEDAFNAPEGCVAHDKAIAITREADASYVQRRVLEQRPATQQREKGDKVFGVEKDSAVFRGRVLSHRGVEVRIGDESGTVRTFHARYVFSG